MAWLIFSVLALLATQGFGEIVEDNATPKIIADRTFLQKQIDLIALYFHIHEPLYDTEAKVIAQTWDLEKNIENFKNVTALKFYFEVIEYGMQLPRSIPFNIYNRAHQLQAVNLFNLLYSAKDYNTFYKTAVYLRDRINEGMFVYVLSVAIIHHPETQGIVIPPIYEVFPSYFHNSVIMNMAQRINTYGNNLVRFYPETYIWDDNVVIRWNTTIWPFAHNVDNSIAYYTNDYHLNALYYNSHLTYPFWLSGKTAPLTKFHRGEYIWYINNQFVSHYYLDRLSNGLGEIPELNLDMIYEGYQSGLVYPNGIPFPVRPDYFNLKQPQFMEHIERIKILERRIRDAIEIGYLESSDGEKISLRTPEALSTLTNVIEGNVDSPNLRYYGSLVTLWKELLGNSIWTNYQYVGGYVAMDVPSPLELYPTTLRDPAFYMIWKRMLNIINLYQSYLPSYTMEELSLPGVEIEKVEIDKLVTFFEYTYLNVTNDLYMNGYERKTGQEQVSVLVQRPQLNHKHFSFRVHVKSNAAKRVIVSVFLAPKYDSKGYEIPIHKNTQNFFQVDQFVYELPEGQTVIKRDSTGNMCMIDKWLSGYEVYVKAMDALRGKGEFVIDTTQFFDGYPRRMQLPKGHVGGMPFLVFISISEYHAPSKPYGSGVNPENSLGIGTGARRMTKYPLNYPLDRPIYQCQTEKLTNIRIEEVKIYHKQTPEIVVPFNY